MFETNAASTCELTLKAGGVVSFTTTERGTLAINDVFPTPSVAVPAPTCIPVMLPAPVQSEIATVRDAPVPEIEVLQTTPAVVCKTTLAGVRLMDESELLSENEMPRVTEVPELINPEETAEKLRTGGDTSRVSGNVKLVRLYALSDDERTTFTAVAAPVRLIGRVNVPEAPQNAALGELRIFVPCAITTWPDSHEPLSVTILPTMAPEIGTMTFKSGAWVSFTTNANSEAEVREPSLATSFRRLAPD